MNIYHSINKNEVLKWSKIFKEFRFSCRNSLRVCLQKMLCVCYSCARSKVNKINVKNQQMHFHPLFGMHSILTTFFSNEFVPKILKTKCKTLYSDYTIKSNVLILHAQFLFLPLCLSLSVCRLLARSQSLWVSLSCAVSLFRCTLYDVCTDYIEQNHSKIL